MQMQPSKLISTSFLFTSLAIIVLAKFSCETVSQGQNWQYAGVESVIFDSIAVPASLYSLDTLHIQLWSRKISTDRFDSLTISLVRDSSSAYLTAKIAIFNWLGNTKMPPTNPYPLQGTLYSIDPPFKEGLFKVIAVNPDSNLIERSLTVLK